MSDEASLLQDKIDAVEAQATSLREAMRSMDSDVELWASKRDSLNNQVKQLREDIRRFKAQRDLLHEKIQKLKAERDNLNTGLQEERRKYRALMEQARSLTDNTARSADEVQRQIESLDWEIQTNPMTPDQEAQIIKQIRALEQENAIHRNRSLVNTKLTGLRQAIAAFKHQLFEVNEQIHSFAAESQEHHLQMLAKTEEFLAVKDKADHAHQRFLDCLTQTKALRTMYNGCMQRLRDLTAQIRRLEEEKRKRVVDAEAEAQSKTATEKLKEKKKMSFEEFKALLDKGLV
jgi:phosphoserine phosphatase